MQDLRPKLKLYMPQKARQVFSRPSRYKILEGGRGSGKSFTFGNMSVGEALHFPYRFLCARETQMSIRDSVHKLLCDIIGTHHLDNFFTIRQDSITSKAGAEFIFRGLHHNISEIKSMEGIDRCWIAEGERITRDSLDVLIPTIRKPGSQIWVDFNPESADSAVYKYFIENPPPDCMSAHLNYYDNDLFPDVLMQEMEYCKRVDYEKYEWIWLGKLKKYAEDVIFKNKCEFDAEFDTPAGTRFYIGLDFGFSNDPLSCHRYWIKDNNLYIDYEVYGRGIELEEIPSALLRIPDIKRWEIGADSSRPDTISFLHNKGFRIVGAEKGEGSVEDGITFLRGFDKIIIHKRCPGAKDDYNNYRWKRDRVSEEILPIPIDKSNHACDDSRYALWRYLKQKVSSFEVLRNLK